MDVRLSPEQRALRDSAVQVVDRLGPQTVRQLDDDERAAKLDAAIGAAGWRELRMADDTGGPLASGVEAAIVAEELGRGLADAPFVGPTLAADLRRRAGAPSAPSPPAGCVAVDAHGATTALLLVPVAGGHALAQVATQASNAPVDLTREVATVDPSAAVDPVAGQARPLTDADLTRWTALGLALAAADLVGTMRGAVHLATEYAKERRQYGSPIGSFQAVQHLLADAFVALEGSRSVALHAAWAVDALEAQDAFASAALAKAYSARAARAVCETAIQVHGGIGNTWECLAHVHLRRALLSTDLLGGIGPCLERVLHHHDVGGGRGVR
jgi:alkylation response protein AidB-like acyl-CoA dehydrogenase